MSGRDDDAMIPGMEATTPTPPGKELDRAHRRRQWLMFGFWGLTFVSAAIVSSIPAFVACANFSPPIPAKCRKPNEFNR